MNHVGHLVAEYNGLKAVFCNNCGFVHLDPLPTQYALDNYYRNFDLEYGLADGKKWLEAEKKEYRSGWKDAGFKWQTRLIGDGSALDIGAGAGWYVHFRKNYSVLGIEPSRVAREFFGFFLYQDKDELPRGCKYVGFTALRFSLVLEHIYPVGLIKEYLPYLRDNGKIMIIVPNEFNPLQQRLRKTHGDWFVNHRHLNYFTKASIRRLLKSLGLTIVFEGATFPMELFALGGLDYIGNSHKGEMAHNLRLRFERVLGPLAFDLYSILYRRLGWGREMVVVAKKC